MPLRPGTLAAMTSALLSTPPVTAPPRSPSALPPARPRLRRTCYEPRPGDRPGPPEPPGPLWRPAPGTPVVATTAPGAREAVVRILRTACEVLDGRRPPQHLSRHADDTVLRYWRAAARARQVRSPARFGRVRIDHPHPAAAEVALAVHLDGRVRALAARFDLTDSRWLWTAVRLG